MATEKKAVLNVTVAESIAAATREQARQLGTTVSSVVEEALADQLKWYKRRQEAIAEIDAYFDEHGWPTAEEQAATDAQLAEDRRLIAEADERRQAKRRGSAA
jgi:post-segregation antitoxin (ccd killing protein)